MRKVLVVNVNWLGDAILTIPIFEALKKTLFCYTAVMLPERIFSLFKDNPYIDEIILFDERGSHRSFFSKLKFVKYLKAKHFDTVFFLHRSFTKAFICLLAGIKERIGYVRLKNFFILTKRIEPLNSIIHRQDYYFYLFEKSGIHIENKLPKIFINNKAKGDIENLIKNLRKKYNYIIGMHVGANWNLKRWPEINFANLADLLIEKLNCIVMFTGIRDDFFIINNVIRNIKNKDKIYNLCGKTDLNELAIFFSYIDMFISSDSGPSHLAAAIGIKTLVLFGPTSEKITSPRGEKVYIIRKDINCKIPCYNLSCKDNICMKNINIMDVFMKVMELLKNG